MHEAAMPICRCDLKWPLQAGGAILLFTFDAPGIIVVNPKDEPLWYSVVKTEVEGRPGIDDEQEAVKWQDQG